MKKVWCFDIIIFLAAFLLFQIELIISKILLPKFGGGYSVWGAALVFFQGTLLLGYLYSHFVIQKYGIFRYRYFHLGLLFLTLFFFPGKPLPAIYPYYQIPMVANIFWQLLRSIGLVFFVLSTTSIIFQSWLANSELPERSNPYVLYAVSNLGSFVGLLSYPFIFETSFALNTQLNIWRIIYFVLLGLHLIAFKLINVRPEETKPEQVFNSIGLKERLRWFLLGAAGVIMFLSVTNIITYEVAPIPLLWILPLCLYLISFVLNFKRKPWCPSWIKENLHTIVALSIFLFFLTQKRVMPFMIELICHLTILFAVCMLCQSELNRHKPADSHNLTWFYLMISSGGFIGGFLVSWIIPLISTVMIEYLVGLFIISIALAMDEKKIRIDPYRIRLVIYTIFLIIIWPIFFKGYNIFGIVIIIMIFKRVYSEFRTQPFTISLSLLFILCLSSFIDLIWSGNFYIYRHRNYYGIHKIYEEKGKRLLCHGSTMHGAQYIIRDKEMEPLTYFHYSTPFGKVMTSGLFNFDRIGLIGLGSGTIAAYGKTGQVMDFFELDPDVLQIANQYFTYLKKSKSKINFILGDARLSLKKIQDKHYDLIVIDAFSGDSIPIHLLTIEAITEYLRCITDEGIILFHISNRYVDLQPVLFRNAQALNLYACADHYSPPEDNDDASPSLWLALMRNSDALEKFSSQLKWRKFDSIRQIRNFRPWTDQYSNILLVLEVRDLFSQIKEFRPFYWDFSLTGY
jgi:hypothetical protein